MNIYNYLLRHEDVANTLYAMKIIPTTIERDVELYRLFAELSTQNPNRTINWCVSHVSRTKNTTNSTVYRAITKMETII